MVTIKGNIFYDLIMFLILFFYYKSIFFSVLFSIIGKIIVTGLIGFDSIDIDKILSDIEKDNLDDTN